MKFWLFFLVTEVILGGCSRQETVSDLIRDNPFTVSSKARVVETEILQIRSYPVECPGHLKLSELPSWPKPLLSSGPPPSGAFRGASGQDGFSPGQIRLWAQNGMGVSVVSPDQLQPLLASLLQNGGNVLMQTTYFFRNNQEIAHFRAKWINSPITLFLVESNTHLRGISLAEGEVLFRFNGQPLAIEGNPRKIHVNLVPIFQSSEQRSVFFRDRQGRPRTARESTVVVFDKLLLSGIVEDGAVILISPIADEALGSLGEVFLKNADHSEFSQLVLMLVPKLIKAKRTRVGPGAEPE